MKPKTLSASSLETAQGCLARFKAENIDYTPRTGDMSAANVGTSVHGALEEFVQLTCIDKTEAWELDTLVLLYHKHYRKTFDSSDYTTEQFKDGLSLTKKWFKRTDLSGVEVLSVEQKRRIPVPTSEGDIPFTYIWDRCDRFTENGQTVIRVVDYKTIRANLGPADLLAKIQARIYAVAAAIQFKDEKPDIIWVEFDLLRYEPVAVRFNRDQLKDTWQYMKSEAERIIAAPYNQPPETLNPSCGYCVRKASCDTLKRNINGGGIHSVLGIPTTEEPPIENVMKLYKEVKDQAKGLKNLIEELDGLLLAHSRENDLFAWEAEQNGIKLKANNTARTYRKIEALDVYRILGGEMFAAYGKITLKDVESLLEDPKVTDEQREAIQRCYYKEAGNPSFNVEVAK